MCCSSFSFQEKICCCAVNSFSFQLSTKSISYIVKRSNHCIRSIHWQYILQAMHGLNILGKKKINTSTQMNQAYTHTHTNTICERIYVCLYFSLTRHPFSVIRKKQIEKRCMPSTSISQWKWGALMKRKISISSSSICVYSTHIVT